jgi:hypothetical protein
VFVPRTSSTSVAAWFWQTEGRSAECVILGGPIERVHLVGVLIFTEKNFYWLPFTPPSSGLLIGPSTCIGPLHIVLLHIECNPYHSIGLDWFITLAGTVRRRR